MERCQGSKRLWPGLAETQEGQGPRAGTQAQGIRQRVSLQNQVSRAGEGMGAEPHHPGAWAALIPKPESGLDPEDDGAAEIQGDVSGLRAQPFIY